MRARTVVTCTCWVAILAAGCSAASRHRVLTRFFDGVPPPKTAGAVAGSAAPAVTSAASAPRVGSTEHGPYQAKMCSACHAAQASNALVAPKGDLCFRCHAPEVDKRYLHGPMASGACLMCHDPHSSRYSALLVTDPGSLCLRCHERQVVSRIEGHADLQEDCTTCHDAHGSDTKYLLK